MRRIKGSACGTVAVLAAAAIALAACGDVEPVNEQAVQVPNSAATQTALEDLPEGQRNGVFIRAIRDAGRECQHVESSRQTGEAQGFPIWTARCTDSGEWNIVIANDGTAQVISASEGSPGAEALLNAAAQ